MLTINFSPFPVLETERMILRKPSSKDRQMFFEIRGNAETMRFIPRPLVKNLEETDELLDMINGFTDRNEKINWTMAEKGTDKMLGMIGYPNFKPESHRAEVGYVLHKDYLRKGYTLEAMKAVLDYGFKGIGLHSIEAIIRPENTASGNLVKKLGFVKEAYFRDYTLHNNEFLDQEIYSLINTL